MDIETIKIKTTLKIGDKVWRKGLILSAPFPPELQEQLRADVRGETIEVLKRVSSSPPEVVEPFINSPTSPSSAKQLLRRSKR